MSSPRRRWRRIPAIGLGLLAVLWSGSARATWSIVAVDPETREVGVAVASCVEGPAGTRWLPEVAALAPGVGALAAQARFDPGLRDAAWLRLREGTSPQALVDAMVADDPDAASRQYGVVTLDLRQAAFTGGETEGWAGHRAARGVSVQGNLLVREQVVSEALAAFEADAPRCGWTLADRLLVALEAGAAQGGDRRCAAPQTALAAALRVARAEDDPSRPSLDLRIPAQPRGGADPVAQLRGAYDAWRIEHPRDEAGCRDEPPPRPPAASGRAGVVPEVPRPESSTTGCRVTTPRGAGPGALLLWLATIVWRRPHRGFPPSPDRTGHARWPRERRRSDAPR